MKEIGQTEDPIAPMTLHGVELFLEPGVDVCSGRV